MKTIPSILTLAAIPGLLSAEVVDGNKGELVEPRVRPMTVADIEGRKGRTVSRSIIAVPQDINPGFAPGLYAQLSQEEGNVFFSPYSITEAMAMVHSGAGGNTATEIANALSIDGDQKTLAQRLLNQRRFLMAQANKDDNKLNIANALCVTGMAPEQAYQDLVRKQFQGELFAGGLDKINGWVKEKTEGKIEKILEELSPDSVCVLLNAVYFKGKWQTPFKSRMTHKAPFFKADGKEVKVDMMTREGGFRVLRDNGLTAVDLPYQTSSSMVLIQPDKAGGMEALEKRLNEGLLTDLGHRLSQSRMERAKLYLPKFKIATEYDLIPAMKELGVKDAFGFAKSDFKAMYAKSSIKIAQIKHKATLEVDEAGSVAAAATAVEMVRKSAAIRPPAAQIRFDRPFLVLIREKTTGTNLFVGRINDPTK